MTTTLEKNPSMKERTFKSLEHNLKKLQLEAQQGDASFDYWGFKIPRKELSLLCAWTGHGKTAFAIDIAVNMRKKGLKVAFITCEMTSEEIEVRSIRNILSDYNPLHTLSQERLEEVKKYNFDIYDTASLAEAFSLSSLKDLIEDLVDDQYDTIILDYFQVIDKEDSESKQPLRLYLKEIAAYMRYVAKKNNIYFICTAQTNKEASIKYTMLDLGNISESIDIVRNAGYVIGIFKMKFNKRNTMTSAEIKELDEYEKRQKGFVAREDNNKFIDLVYLKELKTRQQPLDTGFKLLNFNYGLVKSISEFPSDGTSSSSKEYQKEKDFVIS